MDPINNVPTNPATAPTPAMPPVTPVAPVNPVAPAPTAPVNPVATPAPTPVTVPTQAPANQAAPTVPVNPVINPAAQAAASVNPVFRPTGGGLVAATDPITMPNPPKAPDPIEEELKAPFKAADPVPGSIGSAISVPSGDTATAQGDNVAMNGASAPQTPSVSFTDPAAEPTPVNNKPAKKKTSRSTLILLSVVAAMVVIALVAVLVVQLM